MSNCTYCHSTFTGNSQFCCQSCELLSNWQIYGESPLEKKIVISDKWLKYNQVELEKTFNFSKCPVYKKFRFYIEGMQCSSCVHLLEDFPNYCEDITFSQVNYAKQTFVVEAKNSISLGTICQAIEQLGYEPTVLKESVDYESAKKNENRNDLKRIGIAGAVAGNAMLFSIPIYAGLNDDLGFVFNWISFFIFLPIIFYVAIPFYKKAWASLLVRRVNIDMMIVVALLSGFIFSTYSLIKNSNEIYFDSTASFIFLILLTRYLLKHHQNKLLNKSLFSDLFVNEVYEVQVINNLSYLTFDQIKENQLFYAKKNQLVPCDAILQSEKSEFDISFLTGEAYPQVRHQGDRILAGSRLLSVNSSFFSVGLAVDSHLAISLNRVDTSRNSHSAIQTLSDLISHRLTLVVFSIAGLFFILTYQSLGIEAFKRCLALITIACPCAVAFGTPLAQSLGLRKAAQKGFYITSETVFEKLIKIKKIIFDKTGTLTDSQLNLVSTIPAEISETHKSIILGLEKLSMHPVALSLKSIWANFAIKDIPEVCEIAGLGVEAIDHGRQYGLFKSYSDSKDNLLQVDFLVDHKKTSSLFFKENIKDEASDVIQKFQNQGFDIKILSGDCYSRALEVSQSLGISSDSVFAEQSAQSKQIVIQNENPCIYIGDGLNDIEALAEAEVSFALKGAFESTFQVSSIYAPQKDLNSISEMIDLSKKIHRTVKTNLAFALLYNGVGGAFALAGFINPLVAAVLMPISSFLITVHTVARLK